MPASPVFNADAGFLSDQFQNDEVFILIRIHTLSSGSSGNAALLSRNDTHVLLDAGISCRRIRAALRGLDVELSDLSAVLITHTHSDHISGVQTLIRNCDVPVYASEAACRNLTLRIPEIRPRLCACRHGRAFQVGAFTVTPFQTSHDAPGSSGFRFDDAGFLTDSGCVTEEASATLEGVRLLLLEANHDITRLCSGPYPYFLKQRILSDQGHLSNDAAARYAVSSARSGTETIVLAHLSAENNTPELALSAVSSALRADRLTARLSVAPRNTVSECYCTEELPCSELRSSASEN
jgi:phosphoribosyl 1,2-cyclic phosphodiesterase